jgi:hypothetical protein
MTDESRSHDFEHSPHIPVNRKFLLLLLLGAAALGAWKAGSPSRATTPSAPAPQTADNGGESGAGYGDRKDAKCCDKPPSKSALLQKP